MSWYDRASVIPGRSSTCSKAPGRFMPIDQGPLYGAGHHGSLLMGDDGRQYIDMLCALGAVSLGYHDRWSQRFPRASGVSSLPSTLEIEAAEQILEHVAPWASCVKFVKTGSEATHAAYRIAKKVTGRDFVLVGDWAYHGWNEWCQETANFGTFGSRTWRFQHLLHPDGLFHVHGKDIAAVFIEPHRWEAVDVKWLKYLRRICNKHGILLVFDSMIYGGRFALGGTSEYFGVIPDLECFGKAMANGEACAFVVGCDALQEHGGTLVSGTYSGDLTGLSAVLDTLRVYTTEPVIDTLWARGRQLKAGLEHLAAGRDDVFSEGNPVHQRFRFVDKDRGHRFSGEMAKRGVLWHPECTNVMYAHTEAQIDHVLQATEESLSLV